MKIVSRRVRGTCLVLVGVVPSGGTRRIAPAVVVSKDDFGGIFFHQFLFLFDERQASASRGEQVCHFANQRCSFLVVLSGNKTNNKYHTEHSCVALIQKW
jgi:hypothetical protein